LIVPADDRKRDAAEGQGCLDGTTAEVLIAVPLVPMSSELRSGRMSMEFTDLFAGVRVRDIADARAWYERLLGSEPAFFPNEVEAVWAVGEHRWFYLLEDAPKAGSALIAIMVADLDATADAISGRGIEPTELEHYGEARKYVFHDPDGNEIGIGQVPKA
jgi:catechol 2,3-dioxygenase-like lactoylglutathione lyase family enzyme